MTYQHAIAWLHKTFPTRQRTTELLQPELEDHVLSRHDYELATRFLPGPNMDWHLAYGAGTSAAAYGYGSHLARPRWPSWRLRLASVAAFFVGSAYGTFRHLLLYYRFANTLENPQGFITALNHVDQRLGGSGQIGFVFRGLLAKEPEVESDIDPPSSAGMAPDEGWIRNQDNAAQAKSEPGPDGMKSELLTHPVLASRPGIPFDNATNAVNFLIPTYLPMIVPLLPEAERRRDQFQGDPE